MRWRSTVARAATAAVVLVGGWSLAADSAIVDKAVAFHGGPTYDRARVSFTVTSSSGSFDVEARLDGDRFEYIVSAKDQKTKYANQGLARWSGTQWISLQGRPAEDARRFVMERAFIPFLPYGLNGAPAFQGPVKDDLGLETWKGRRLHKVKATFPGGVAPDGHNTYVFWFDPESGRLEQFAYDFTVEGGGLRFRKATTYQRVGGLLFFDQENWGVNGQGLKVDQITPDFVDAKMRLLSTVRLTNIRVAAAG